MFGDATSKEVINFLSNHPAVPATDKAGVPTAPSPQPSSLTSTKFINGRGFRVPHLGRVCGSVCAGISVWLMLDGVHTSDVASTRSCALH